MVGGLGDVVTAQAISTPCRNGQLYIDRLTDIDRQTGGLVGRVGEEVGVR